tara:strand:- start:3027 stop:3761 length:735 start_codon:yes stop_codon:yes gene_type:complete
MMCSVCNPKEKYGDCICHPSFKTFLNDYEKLHNMDKYESFDIIKPWTISTMTICCSFNSVINLQLYRDFYVKHGEKKIFYNCINSYMTVKYQNKKRISIKIFKNGNIQLAGVLNVISAAYAARKLLRRLKYVSAFSIPDEASITKLRICMINSDFKISKNIKQKSVCSYLDSNPGDYIKRYSYNPSKYPGINLKFEDPESGSKLTIAIFRPGSIILTGGNDITLYFTAFTNLLKILENNNDILY